MYQELKDVWAEMTGETGIFSVTDIEVRGETLKSYALAPNSLRDVWLMSAQFAERDYLIFEDERWTYAEAMAETASIANWMHANGIGHGDRVALAMRNYPEWMLTYWALTSIGIGVVGVNAHDVHLGARFLGQAIGIRVEHVKECRAHAVSGSETNQERTASGEQDLAWFV